MNSIKAFRLVEMFEWNNEDGKTRIKFAVTDMLNAIEAGRLPYKNITVPIDAPWVLKRLPERDLVMSYVNQIKAPRIDEPCLSVHMPEDCAILIDGSHRYMAQILQRKNSVTHRLIALDYWKPYAQIDGVWPPC
jgi:hypothetical protein